MNSLSFFAPTKQGVFLRRPNRFVAECLLEGKTVRAHMPNPGRMRELLFPGVTMWLAEGNEAKRTTAYSVVAAAGPGASAPRSNAWRPSMRGWG